MFLDRNVTLKVAKMQPVTLLLLFGPVMLLCGTFLFILLSARSV